MKIYVDEQKRYEDTKATGQCFTGVGAIGLIAIVLLDTGVIKLAALDSVNKLMVSIVMGLVFLIFFIIRVCHTRHIFIFILICTCIATE
jgi:hypothetical protein